MNELHSLACDLAAAKKAEQAAKDDRIRIEENIAALVDTDANGSKTVDAGDGLKITVKRAMTYKADVDGIRALGLSDDQLPLGMTAPKPPAYVFDSKKYEAIIEVDPDAAIKLADLVDVTPRKVSVTIKM